MGRGNGAPEVVDLRLLEDGGERGGALDSDVVAIETVGEGRSEDGKRAAVSRGADSKAIIRADGAPQAGNLCLLEDGGEHRGAFGSDAVHLQAGSDGKEGIGVSVWERLDVVLCQRAL